MNSKSESLLQSTTTSEAPSPHKSAATTPITPSQRRVIFPMRNNKKYSITGTFPLNTNMNQISERDLKVPDLTGGSSHGSQQKPTVPSFMRQQQQQQKGLLPKGAPVVQQHPPVREERHLQPVAHEYRNHLLSFASFFPPLMGNGGLDNIKQLSQKRRSSEFEDLNLNSNSSSVKATSTSAATATTVSPVKNRSSILPKLPTSVVADQGLEKATDVSGGTASTPYYACSSCTSHNSSAGTARQPVKMQSSPHPHGLNQQQKQQEEKRQHRRSLTSPSRPLCVSRRSVTPPAPTPPPSYSPYHIGSRNLPRLQVSTKPPDTPLKSALKENPKYAIGPVPPLTPNGKQSNYSVPSLVAVHDEESTDEEETSHSSTINDNSNPGAMVDSKDPKSSTSGQHNTASNKQLSPPKLSREVTPPPVTPSPEEEKRDLDNPRLSPRRVLFDPRVWIRIFYRDPVEMDCTWYTNDDMEHFKRLALDRILRYQSPTEWLCTGTGRIVQKTLPNWKGPIYSHVALTLDGENDNDEYMRKKVLEKELQTIMVVDPHDVCLQLFRKSLMSVLPRTAHIVTVDSSSDALKQLEQGKRFDMIIVEERLHLFRKQGSSGSVSTSSSNDDPEGDRPILNPPKSGAELIQSLSNSPVTSHSLLIGTSAHMEEDKAKLQKSGADFCWSKPPPHMDQIFVEELLKTILMKRGRNILATELFG